MVTSSQFTAFIWRFLFIAAFLSILFPVFSQKERKYKSREEDAYYDSLQKTEKEFTPADYQKAKTNPYDYVTIVRIDNPAPYLGNSSIFSDSASTFTIPPNHEKPLEIPTDDDPATFIRKLDSMMRATLPSEFFEKVGIVSKMSVVKEERDENLWTILYTDFKYDDAIWGEKGYWIAISEDNGATWKQYYTGLAENFYYYFKQNSAIPLWKNVTTLQIEAALVRQISPVAHPLPGEYELVEDSIAVLLDFSKIIQDSDGDGLTDIVENKLMLDPYNPDTDGDGIIDSEDKNPRFKSIKTDKSILYESFIEETHLDRRKGEIDLDKLTVIPNHPDFQGMEDVILIVSDDKDLHGVNLQIETAIIMTSEEYKSYKEKYPVTPSFMDISPLFKCDRKKNCYKIHIHSLTSSSTYAVQRTKSGWKIISLLF